MDKNSNFKTEHGDVISSTTTHVIGSSKLGKQIYIGPKSHCTFEKAGRRSQYFKETVSVIIGIGNDHTAELVMTKEAYDALNSGEPVNVTTEIEYTSKYGANVKSMR